MRLVQKKRKRAKRKNQSKESITIELAAKHVIAITIAYSLLATSTLNGPIK